MNDPRFPSAYLNGGDSKMLRAVQSNPSSYLESARFEFERRGRGCLLCDWHDEVNEQGVTTVYQTQGQLRSTLKSGKPLLNWFKKTARPVIQRYDPTNECVVVTTDDRGAPQVSVLSFRSELSKDRNIPP